MINKFINNFFVSFILFVFIFLSFPGYASYVKAIGNAKSDSVNVGGYLKNIMIDKIFFAPPSRMSDVVNFFSEELKKRNSKNHLDIQFVFFSPTGQNPVIPPIKLNDCSFFKALDLVCDVVGYKKEIRGNRILIMHRNANPEELEPLTPREVPISNLPIAYESARLKYMKHHYRRFNKSKGRFVFGKLIVEEGDSSLYKNILSTCYIEKDGSFFGFDGGTKTTHVIFSKFGYKCATPLVPEARRGLREDVAIDLGTIKLNKLKRYQGHKIHFRVKFFRDSRGRAELVMLNKNYNVPQKKEDIKLDLPLNEPKDINFDSLLVADIDITNDKLIKIENCTPGIYYLKIKGNSYGYYEKILDLRNKRIIPMGTIRIY